MSLPRDIPEWCNGVPSKNLCLLALDAWKEDGFTQKELASALGCSPSKLCKALVDTAPDEWHEDRTLSRKRLLAAIVKIGVPKEWWQRDLIDFEARLMVCTDGVDGESSRVEMSFHAAVLANAHSRKKSLLYVAPHHGGYLSVCLERALCIMRENRLEWPFTELRVLLPDPDRGTAINAHPSDRRLWSLGDGSRLQRNLRNIADLFEELNQTQAIPIRCRYYTDYWGYICTAFDGFVMATMLKLRPEGLRHPGHSYVLNAQHQLCKDMFDRFESVVDWQSPCPRASKNGWR